MVIIFFNCQVRSFIAFNKAFTGLQNQFDFFFAIAASEKIDDLVLFKIHTLMQP